MEHHVTPPLVPELAVSDWRQSLAFYTSLGFEAQYQRPEDGFVCLQRGSAVLMLDQIGAGRSFDGGHLPETYPFGRGVNLQIEVTTLAPLLAALAEAWQPPFLGPEVRWYRRDGTELGQRQVVVTDPDGYLLRFFEPLGERPVAPLRAPAEA